ncbi:Permease of the drug/metabolite transporter (DMT) superfamily [Halovenus aranensis]|uniref:Permease of the drug/metabolite transporter (DMT) superfamily n=1 Tax=Halovenus aranensis TaxID=890420 RepID=A0A1G8XEK0_9EURY|nr:EamA family transporter [Halovenus aranensis]SDJ88998.1 Permease of the drug/metabolite transporter (DMT) superfamily [Halovenus aranensis]
MLTGTSRNAVLFVVLSAIWGSAFMAINLGLEFFPAVTFAAIRYDVAGVIMLAYALWVADNPVPSTRGEWGLVAIGAVFLIALYHAFLFVGQTDPAVTSAVAAVIVSLNPVLTTGFARALLPAERLTLLGVAGLCLGLVGVVVLADPAPSNLTGEGTVPKLLVLAAAAAFAFGSVLTRRVEATLEIETLEGWAMLLGGLLMHGIALGLGESPGAIEWTTEAVLALVYLSVVASAFGFLIYFDLLERLGPIEINLVSYVAPAFAAISGWLFLSEGISPATVAGFSLIFLGFLLIKRRAIRDEIRRQRRPPTAD